MKFNPRKVLILVMITCVQAWGDGERRCAEIHRDISAVSNSNIEVQHFLQYQQTMFRGIGNYAASFGPQFESLLMELKPGALIIDSGSGLGFMGMERIWRGLQGKGSKIQVEAVNYQPFHEQFVKHLEEIQKKPNLQYQTRIALSPGKKVKVSTASLSEPGSESIERIAQLLDVPPIEVLERDLTEADVRNFLAETLKRIKEIKSAGFREVSGKKSEQALRATQKNADLIVDLFGSFYYSPERPALLEAMYRNLGPDGTAFIGFDEVAVSMVEQKGKSPISLTKYLTENFPDVFQSGSNGKATWLMMKRSQNRAKLDLDLEISGYYKKPQKDWAMICVPGACEDLPDAPQVAFRIK